MGGHWNDGCCWWTVLGWSSVLVGVCVLQEAVGAANGKLVHSCCIDGRGGRVEVGSLGGCGCCWVERLCRVVVLLHCTGGSPSLEVLLLYILVGPANRASLRIPWPSWQLPCPCFWNSCLK